MCTCAHVLMYCCNCVWVHVCMCTCANVFLQWCQWCLCAWACALHIMHVCMCCCVVVLVHVACASVYPSHLLHLHTCVITSMKRAYLGKTHAVQHCHAVLTSKQDTCILKQATTMLACSADTAMAKKKNTQNCSSMLSMRLTSACPLVLQVTDLHAGWAIFFEVLTML